MTCSFGQSSARWCKRHHCGRCAQAVKEACRRFRAAVQAGTYDTEGYTPNERKAQQRRKG